MHALNFTRNVHDKDPSYGFQCLPFDPQFGYGYVNWADVDVLWNVGFFFNANRIIEQIKTRNPGMKVVNMWCGSDILETEQVLNQSPQAKTLLFKDIDEHVTDWVGFQREIKEKFGIESKYVPSIPARPMAPKPLPKEFTIAVYMPRERLDFFQYGTILTVAKTFPKTSFHLFPSHKLSGREQAPPASKNMHFMDFVQGREKEDWWAKSSVLIVIPVHGSISVTGIEFMQMGRAVITNQEAPYMMQANTPEQIVGSLQTVKKRKQPDRRASQYYIDEFSPKTQLEHTLQILRSCSS